jgi:Bacterial Ig domain
MRRKGTIVLYGLMCALACLLASCAAALAGTYEVGACNDAPSALNNSWTWSTTDLSQPAHYAEHVECPDRVGGTGGTSDQEGGLSTTDALGLSDGAPPRTSAGWSFIAPQGTTVTELDYERYIGHIFDSNNYWSPALRADGTPVTGESCLDTVANGETCFVGGPPDEGGEPGIITGLSAHELALSILCEAPAEQECITGATKYKAWAAIYGARVTLSDPTPPTLDTPTGPLWEPGTSAGFHKGTETVTTSAQDIGGGVQSIVLSADGKPRQTFDASCDFTFAQPCPLSIGGQTLTLPTTSLTDGTHTLTLTAIDAAGNPSIIASEQIIIDNDAPPPPTELTATPTQPGSTIFTATWTNPSGQVAPITSATYQICPANGSQACSTPVAAPAEGPVTVTVPGPGAWRLAVWLTNAAGNSNPTNPASTRLTVPTNGQSDSGTGQPNGQPGNSGSGSGSSNTGPSNTGARGSKATLSLSETLHRRGLVIHVSGPATGEVRVSYTAHYHKKLIASGAKRVPLKHGRLTTTFRLTALVAANATIRVSVQLNHQKVVISTLRR